MSNQERSLTRTVQEVHDQAHHRDPHVDHRGLCVVPLQATALQPRQLVLLPAQQHEVRGQPQGNHGQRQERPKAPQQAVKPQQGQARLQRLRVHAVVRLCTINSSSLSEAGCQVSQP